jgi:beta-glucanase (GH16 family)
MPESNNPDGSGVYGPWPRSGEIDIVESRGNFGDDYPDGRDSVISALHWGPLPEADGFWRTSGKHNLRRTDYSESFHTYGLEWNENYLFTYIDTRLLVRTDNLTQPRAPYLHHDHSKSSSLSLIKDPKTCGRGVNSGTL